MEAEPKMEIVINADKDPKNIALGVDRLKSLIERIERLQEEIKELQKDVNDVFAEAKSIGYDVKIMRAVIRLRKMNAVDQDEQEYLLDTYKKALGL